MVTTKVPFEDITKEDFEAYEKVRSSGETNMLDIPRVIQLSDYHLDHDTIVAIISHYSKLMKKYPEVRQTQ
jgi:hypothetical protein